MDNYALTQEEITIGVRELTTGIVYEPDCLRCRDGGIVCCYDPRYNVGFFWNFCNCEAGKTEEAKQYLETK